MLFSSILIKYFQFYSCLQNWPKKEILASKRLRKISNFRLKLDRRGSIRLPAPRRKAYNHRRSRHVPDVLHGTDRIETELRELLPISIADARQDSYSEKLFNYFLYHYHYLSFGTTVGENMKYLIKDSCQRPLACLLFGAAAWSLKARDEFIGWSPETRQANLSYITNNTRFLILPWVHVANLASHILAKVAKQLNSDWMRRYNHQIYMIETFVDTSRFKGICYQAANFAKIGRSTGRTRQDRYATIKEPVKEIYLYTLCNDYNQKLTHERPRHSGS